MKRGAKVIIEHKDAKKLQELARHEAIVQLEKDILMDMAVCEVEGWNKMEFLTMLRDFINGFFKRG